MLTKEFWESDKRDWIDVNKLNPEDIPIETTCINVDTRDMAAILSFKPVTTDFYGPHSGNSKKVFRAYPILIDSKIKPEFLIDRSQIIPFLRMIKQIKGNQYILDFNLPNVHYNGWDFKYLRIFKHTKLDGYVVCTDTLKAVKWQEMNENTIEKHF